jgi:hypothetical protein
LLLVGRFEAEAPLRSGYAGMARLACVRALIGLQQNRDFWTWNELGNGFGIPNIFQVRPKAALRPEIGKNIYTARQIEVILSRPIFVRDS